MTYRQLCSLRTIPYEVGEVTKPSSASAPRWAGHRMIFWLTRFGSSNTFIPSCRHSLWALERGRTHVWIRKIMKDYRTEDDPSSIQALRLSHKRWGRNTMGAGVSA